MSDTKRILNVDINELIILAEELNLVCLVRTDHIEILGVVQNLIFKLEETTCQLTEIY